ncbi:MAG: SPOR domain-containing protein [Prevotellaceae bacterium]|nr:SPOR domain-containing protein [Prevotellaceae bacterium]
MTNFAPVNEFSLCIEYLLLKRDSVTVPGLGTFRAEGCPSCYDAQEETLLPPRRQVSFDASRHGDEGLTRSIAEIYSITEEEAGNKLCLWLNDFAQTLADSGYVELGSLGTFAGEEAGMSFTPSQAGVTTPDFYALDTVHIKETERKKTPVIKTDSRHITISISKRVAAYAAAACVAVALFLWLSTPTGFSNSYTTPEGLQRDSRGFQPTVNASSLFLPTGFSLSPDVPEETSPVEVEPQPAEVEAEECPEEAQETQATAQEPRYCIVMASAVSRKNAEAYVSILQQRGLDSPRLMEGKILRVVVGAYDTADEAYRAARELHRLSDEYFYAWVYERK